MLSSSGNYRDLFKKEADAFPTIYSKFRERIYQIVSIGKKSEYNGEFDFIYESSKAAKVNDRGTESEKIESTNTSKTSANAYPHLLIEL